MVTDYSKYKSTSSDIQFTFIKDKLINSFDLDLPSQNWNMKNYKTIKPFYLSGADCVRSPWNGQADKADLLHNTDVQRQRPSQLPEQRLADCDAFTGDYNFPKSNPWVEKQHQVGWWASS